jgi:hypothetical protein
LSARADLSGRRFGRLTALRYAHSDDGGRAHWFCQCDCGATTTVRGKDLGKQTSCGCQKREQISALKLTHGKRWTKAYKCWQNMLARCRTPTNKSFKDYGARGIKVLYASFEAFFADMGEPPPGMTLDRRDNDGNYEPGNCRWATPAMQRANRRS